MDIVSSKLCLSSNGTNGINSAVVVHGAAMCFSAGIAGDIRVEVDVNAEVLLGAGSYFGAQRVLKSWRQERVCFRHCTQKMVPIVGDVPWWVFCFRD